MLYSEFGRATNYIFHMLDVSIKDRITSYNRANNNVGKQAQSLKREDLGDEQEYDPYSRYSTEISTTSGEFQNLSFLLL